MGQLLAKIEYKEEDQLAVGRFIDSKGRIREGGAWKSYFHYNAVTVYIPGVTEKEKGREICVTEFGNHKEGIIESLEKIIKEL